VNLIRSGAQGTSIIAAQGQLDRSKTVVGIDLSVRRCMKAGDRGRRPRLSRICLN
jgi:hypothetical protein